MTAACLSYRANIQMIRSRLNAAERTVAQKHAVAWINEFQAKS